MKFNDLFGYAKFVVSDAKAVGPQMRGTFFVNHPDAKTEIMICGLGYFDLKINGKHVSDELFVPAASHYHHYDSCACYEKFGEELSFRIYVMRYDISDLVKEGENVIAVELGRGWYTTADNPRFGLMKLCYQITNGDETFFSDRNVKWRDGCITESDFNTGESQDYTKADFEDGWEFADYDASAWTCATEIEAPESNYIIQTCPSDKIIRTVYPRLVSETDESKLYDLGECITGWPIVRCLEKNTEIKVKMGEKITDNKFDDRWGQRQFYSVITDGVDREYHPKFCYQAFSCVEVSANADLVRCDVIHTDIRMTSEFVSDNNMINWFHDTFVRTQLINIHNSIPSDCPHLEKRGYTGDGQLACETVMTMFDAREVYLKWMEDIADSQDRISGHIQYTAPYVLSGGGPGGWGCAIIEVPYVYYKIYGDRGPLEKYFDHMLHFFDYLEAHSENDLIISDQPGLWCLGEWCCPNVHHALLPAIPAPYVNTYFYIKSLDRMVEIASILEKNTYREQFLATRVKKAEAVEREYFDEKTGNFADNKNSANAFAVDLGLGDERTFNNLVVDNLKRGTFNTGIFGTDILVRILFERGLGELAVDLITTEKAPSFSYMMRNGATTLWEDWFGPRSLCHPMFGALTRYFYYYLLGIRQEEDSKGYESVVVDPAYCEQVKQISGKVQTPYGDIQVKIDRKWNHTISITVPSGIRASFKDEYGTLHVLKTGTTSFALRKEPSIYDRKFYPRVPYVQV